MLLNTCTLTLCFTPDINDEGQICVHIVLLENMFLPWNILNIEARFGDATDETLALLFCPVLVVCSPSVSK